MTQVALAFQVKYAVDIASSSAVYGHLCAEEVLVLFHFVVQSSFAWLAKQLM